MITVVIGPPCAGKSTLIAEKRGENDPVIDFDAICKALGSPNHHDAPDSIRRVATSARAAAVNRILKGVDDNAWIIHTSPSDAQLDAYRDAKADLVLLDPGIEECLKRVESDSRPERTSETIREWYKNPPVIPAEKRSIMSKVKATVAELKADGDGLSDGQFVGYASVFGNKDSYGDVVVKGAFASTIEGRQFPIYWQHRTDDPDLNIGKTVEIREDDHGLLVKGQLDLDSAKGAQVHRLIKEGRVSQMSFMYDVVKQAEVDGGPWNGGHMELQELKLHEVSIVPVGANQETELLAVKTGSKAGRTISAKNESKIKAAYEALGEILSSIESDNSDVSGEEPKSGKAEEPETVKAEDQSAVKARKDPDAALALINALTI